MATGVARGFRVAAESFLTRPIAHTALLVIFALLALAAGICTIAAAIRSAGKEKPPLLLWDGISVSVAGLVILVAPDLDLTWFVHIIAGWAITVGVLELLIARALRRHVPDEWSLSLAGLGSLILGAYFLFQRSDEGASLVRWLGLYAAFNAVTILALAFRLYTFRSAIHQAARHAELPSAK